MSEPSRIVGIFGQKENGKSSVRKYITLSLLKSHMIFHRAFATPIKEVLSILTDENVEKLDSIKGQKLPGWRFTVRDCYCILSDMIKQMRPGYFLDRALGNDEFSRPLGNNIIIDDGRYEEEAKRIKDLGGQTILVIRPSHHIPPKASTHSSEEWLGSEAGKFLWSRKAKVVKYSHQYLDHIIYNDGSVDQLYDQVNELLPELKEFFTPIPSTQRKPGKKSPL